MKKISITAGNGDSTVNTPSFDKLERINSGFVPFVLTTISSGAYCVTSKRNFNTLLPSGESCTNGELISSNQCVVFVDGAELSNSRPNERCVVELLFAVDDDKFEPKNVRSRSINCVRNLFISSSIFFISSSNLVRIELNS
ncbi:hypothetical protein DERP_006238 [Dermatophagoides pteronyssinus]|uniref:Uncharacterized protein n=1 Tax=Dermatophagoides pteronyssinus TaxID=6956 RepID=A0ABQ8IXV0_DERPT|nr:hypothetical protein DERP_006238 [Dermatophagoides pteronyssinus]